MSIKEKLKNNEILCCFCNKSLKKRDSTEKSDFYSCYCSCSSTRCNVNEHYIAFSIWSKINSKEAFSVIFVKFNDDTLSDTTVYFHNNSKIVYKDFNPINMPLNKINRKITAMTML